MAVPRRLLARLGAAATAVALVAGCASGQGAERSATGDDGAPATEAPGRPAGSVGPTTEAPTTTTTAPPATTTTTTTTTTAPPPPVEEGPLQSGAAGLRTLALQESLARVGFDPGEVDGRFGPKTTMAVWAFQALHGLPKDGIVGPELEELIRAEQPLGMLRPDLGPTHTEVDLDRQVLLVWRDGALALVTHVSTGSGVAYCEDGHCGDAVTPVGDYRYQRRIEGERHAPLGVLYDPVYFVGGIAVHGAPSVPNHPASHGCVRIPMHISAYFQDLVADGEPIATFRGGTGPATAVGPAAAPPEPAPDGAENGG